MESKTKVNSVSETNRKSVRCFRCGKEGHFAWDQSCPAHKATCHKCHNQGHFATMCKTKKRGNHELESGKGNKRRQKASSKQRLHNVHDAEGNDEYAFSVSEGYACVAESGTVQLNVGGATLRDVWIDSGASCNVVDKET